MSGSADALGQFQTTLLELLERHPDGISEYALFNQLAALSFPDYHETERRSALGLFRAHFALFHALYRLRDRLWGERSAQLDIHTLCIQLRPYYAQQSDLPSRRDPLRDYYLDLRHLQDTSASDVDQLLGKFWRRFGPCDRREQALGVLGLNDPVDDVTIKQTWRRLAMQHHPDRGGSEQRLQEINAALTALLGERNV
jgi:DnaJ-domain-containing protein 1